MRTEDSLPRTPPPPPFVRPSRHDTPRVAGMSRADAYIALHCVCRHTPNQSRFCQSRALRRHRSLFHPVHRRTGQQVSGTTCPCDPVRERANKVFGKRPAQLLSSSSSRLDFLDDLRVRGRLVSNVVFFELLPSPLKLLPSLLQRLLHLQSFGTFVTFRWLCL